MQGRENGWGRPQKREFKEELKMDERVKLIAKYYGYENQRNKFVEETGELLQAIGRYDCFARGTNKHGAQFILEKAALKANVLEEIADVSIMLAQMVYFLGGESIVKEYVQNKVRRQIERIEREKRDSEPVNVIYATHDMENPRTGKKFIWKVPVNKATPSVGEVVKVNCLGGVKNVLVTGIATLPRCEAYSHKTMIGKVFGDEQQE